MKPDPVEAFVEQARRNGLAVRVNGQPLPPLTPARVEEGDEKGFQDAFEKEFRRTGWLGFHPYDARKSTMGFFDWVLIRDRVLFVELKTDKGELRADQLTWKEAAERVAAVAGGLVEYRLWRPSMWAEILSTLAPAASTLTTNTAAAGERGA